MLQARLRLASLWVSQVARILADNCLRIFAVFHLAEAGADQREAAWHLVAALFVFPAIFFAPLNGALSNSLPKRWVLIGSAAYSLGVMLIFGLTGGGWLACLGLVAVGNAIYSPTRYAMLPAAACDARISLVRVNGWIEMGAVSAVVAGMVLGGELYDVSSLTLQAQMFSRMPPAVAAALLLSLLCFLTALPVRFTSDVHRPEPPVQALRGFFRDARRVWGVKETRSCLLALACFRGLVLVAPGAVIASSADFQSLIRIAILIMIGAAAGSLLAGVQSHPARSLGLVPLGATGLAVAFLWAAQCDPVPDWLCLVLGVMGGLINVPLFATYQAALPADARGNGVAFLNTAGNICMSGMAILMAGLARSRILVADGQIYFVAVLAALGAVVAWRFLHRHGIEQLVELLFWPIYRIHGHGPGLHEVPRSGPLLVVANHSCWFDPVFLGKILPRQLTPMLTSVFFDKPILRLPMTHIFHAIRVELSRFRREAPELAEAIAALDRGETVLIFPEGQLRKREELPLRRFGRGVWHILKERPETPVVVCWIEGGWKSYTSYHLGPPTKNKRWDCWRRIDVAVSEPEVLDPSVLADHHVTRAHLMKACLDARRHIGLVSLPTNHLPELALTAEEGEED